jgi:hypothetical protein
VAHRSIACGPAVGDALKSLAALLSNLQDGAVSKPAAGALREAASQARRALTPAVGADWNVTAGDLEWTASRTLNHMVNALMFYSAQLARLASERLPRMRDGDERPPPGELLDVLESAAAVLEAVALAAPEGARAFHPAGMADADGFVAMGIDEILIHTADIAKGLRIPFEPTAEVAAAALRRLFPWAPGEEPPWAALLWANGRAELAGHERLGPDWGWHCAPLQEWDGVRRVRTSPPGWS